MKAERCCGQAKLRSVAQVSGVSDGNIQVAVEVIATVFVLLKRPGAAHLSAFETAPQALQ
jgi:hypothetical protein